MSKPVNLNKARKDRDRSLRKSRADENAVRFGQTKAQKDLAKAEAKQAITKLDAHKRET